MSKALFVGKDKSVHSRLSKQLKEHKIPLKQVTTLTELRKTLKKEEPLVILFDPGIRNTAKFIDFFEQDQGSAPIIPVNEPTDEALAVMNAAACFRMNEQKRHLNLELEEHRRRMESNAQERSDDLEESLLNYYTVVEQTHEGVVIVQKGKIVFTNSRYAKIIHHTPQNILDNDASIFFPPEIMDLINKIEQEGMIKKDTEYFESNILTQEGKIIPIDVNIQETTFNKERSTILFLEDITERKKLQTQLIHTSNLAAIGQIAIGLAHDINTPLANISLLSENICTNTEDQFILRKLDTMDRQVEIITGIIKNLLSVYRRSREMYSDLNINEVILDTLNISKDLILHDIEMELHFDDDLPFVMGNPEQLGQVFLNLILNSDDSMPENGLLEIKSYYDDSYVYVDFSDNGCGIPEDKLYSIFDPFYTTKKPNKGVGLGLSICQGIVHSHNGKIEVRSTLEEGTTFTVILRR